jgi:hypothetical protein
MNLNKIKLSAQAGTLQYFQRHCQKSLPNSISQNKE